MRRRESAVRRAGLAAVVLLLVMAMTSVAEATHGGVTATTTGGKAVWYSSPNYMYVYDTRADGYSVYAEYCWGTSCSSGTRLYNRSGNGTVKRFTLYPASSDITFRVCRERPFQSDDCGSWTTADA